MLRIEDPWMTRNLSWWSLFLSDLLLLYAANKYMMTGCHGCHALLKEKLSGGRVKHVNFTWIEGKGEYLEVVYGV